jgi:glutathione peroxidase
MSVHQFTVRGIDGAEVSLRQFDGQVLLIVNVASRCGFTPQYTGLEALYEKYRERGFAVLGFPCNQFGSQEPGTEAEIASFCDLQFGVRFPLFAKVDVNGANAKYLKGARPGLLGIEAIKWNFTKFLVDREGTVTRRFSPTDKPEDLDAVIAAAML